MRDASVESPVSRGEFAFLGMFTFVAASAIVARAGEWECPT